MSQPTTGNRITSILLFVAVSIIAVNSYVANIPEVPRWVVIILGAGSVVAIVARESLKTPVQVAKTQ